MNSDSVPIVTPPNLKPIKEASDYEEWWLTYLLRGWIAIDETNGLALYPTRGRGKGGISHYILVGFIVDETKRKTCDDNGRIGSKIAAWDDNEAIVIANRRLAKRTGK